MGKLKEKAFNNFKHNGVHLSFPNGNMISMIWGRGSYTDNYNGTGDFVNDYQTFMGSDTVEIMVDCSGKLFKKLQKRFDTDNTVFGHVTIDQWLKVVNEVAKEVK